jgi:hypothetical protein
MSKSKSREWVQTIWPYDDEAAKTITCWAKKMRVAADVPSRFAQRMVYVWRNGHQGHWNYTVQGELTGSTETDHLGKALEQAEIRSQK